MIAATRPATYDPADGTFNVLRTFGYEDYRTRLS